MQCREKTGAVERPSTLFVRAGAHRGAVIEREGAAADWEDLAGVWQRKRRPRVAEWPDAEC